MSSLSNTTLNCQNVPSGQTYWASFEEKSFARGRHLKAYGGRINGHGPRSGDRCVVKVFTEAVGKQKMCAHEIDKNQKAKSLAKAYNSWLPERDVRVKFSFLFCAQMDEVSLLKQIFFSGRRRLSIKDIVLVEDDLRYGDDRPGRKRELTLFMDNLGKQHACLAKHLEAFAHFTYHHSGGQLVVCDLEGVQDDEGFYLKTPVIHSRKKEYGKTDKGMQGIIEVFKNHVCTELCKDLIKPCGVVEVDHVDNGQDADTTSTVSCTDEDVCPEYGQVVSQDSYNNHNNNNNNNIFRQGYSLSPSCSHSGTNIGQSRSVCCSGNISGYLVEPSAPPEEDCFDELSVSCIPQTRGQVVANWLLDEQFRNSFITSMPFHPSQQMTGFGRPDVSVDNNATSGQMMLSRSPWVESNNSNHALSGGCCKDVTDNHGNHEKPTPDVCNDDYASDSLFTGICSSATSSTHNSCSHTSHTPTRCNNCQVHFLDTHNPSTSHHFRHSHILDSCGLHSVNMANRNTAVNVANKNTAVDVTNGNIAVNVANRNTVVLGSETYQQICCHSAPHFTDSPPPYIE